MKFEGYIYKLKLNASHSVLIDNKRGKMHPHTFEISLFVKMVSETLTLYNDVEKIVEEFLSAYSEKELNLIEPFRKIEPTLESIGDVLFSKLKKVLYDNNIILVKLEISETPARVYIVNYDEESTKYKKDDSIYNDYRKTIIKLVMHSIFDLSTKQIMGDLESVKEDKIKAKDIEKPGEIGKSVGAEKSISEEFENCAVDTTSKENVVKKKHRRKDKNRHVLIKITAAVLILIVATGILLYYMVKLGGYPWGADTYGHIFKADLLYKSIKSGNIYPLFTQFWYNGIQPFRYWPPLPYYIFAACEFISRGNPINAYVVFIGFAFLTGGLGWLLWGIKENKIFISLILGILCFFLPENLRVFFIEGNIPRVVIAAFIPYLFYFLWQFVEHKKKWSVIPMTLFMSIIIMCHLMIAAMIGIAAFLFLLVYSIINKNIYRGIQAIAAMLLSFVICGVWVYPALHGGLVSMDSGATSQMIGLLSTPFTTSLNPILRFLNVGDMDYLYYGLSIFIIAILGLVLSSKKSIPGFAVSIIIFLGTTSAFVPIFKKMPFGQLFWMVRFIPITYGFFIISLLNWKKCKKYFMIAMIVLIAADSFPSFSPSRYPKFRTPALQSILNYAKEVTKQRISLLDSSTFESYPSYYFCSEGKNVPYSYGWAWQGAATAQNIVFLNTALENGYYSYMFDRSVEMGCDTVVVKKNSLKNGKMNVKLLYNAAEASKYVLYKETDEGYVFHRQTPGQFGVTTKYSGLCIGRSASDITLEYPSFETGASWNIEDYTVSELSKYKTLYLSGFTYNSRTKAENMISTLSSMGVNIIIDMNRIPSDTVTNRMTFLGVTAEPVTFDTKLPDLFFNGMRYQSVNFKKDYKKWNTVYLNNVPDVTGFSWMNNKKLTFLGKGNGINKNITFLGFNLMFHAMENEDPGVIDMMNAVIKSNSSVLPERVLIPINVKYGQNSITINSPKDNVNTTIAFLDAYKSKDKIFANQNLLNVKKGQTYIQIIYPYLFQGITLSLAGLLIFVFFVIYIYKKGGKK